LGRGGWKYEGDLGLEGDEDVKWHNYVGNLCSCFIRLCNEEEESLFWFKNMWKGEYIAKLGYNYQMETQFKGEVRWWWEKIWKIHGPVKSKIVIWLALNKNL
jgi:hypothetical protein